MQGQRLTTAPVRRSAEPMPADIHGVQPGGGPLHALESAWGRSRRALLRRLRPRYVARMRELRRGACAGCAHDVVDPRDLKLVHNVCGHRFPSDADRFAWRSRLGVARQGLVEIVVWGGACAGLAIALAALVSVWLALVPALGAVFAVAFFRDPQRTIPGAAGLVVAPADGVVDDIGEVEHCEWLGGPAVRIGIFLSLFDVHVNRAPIDGRVIRIAYRPGQRRATYRVGHTDANEQCSTLLETAAPPHHLLRVRQIAGPAARRIVNELRPGCDVARGERYGLIKFGSRTELFVPRDPAVAVVAAIGTRVRAGESVLVRLAELPG